MAGEARRVRPVVWFAGLGLAVLLLQAWVFGSWIADGPTRTDPGPVDQPGYMDVAVFFMNVVMPIGAVVVLALVLVRPWWRERRITPDGLLLLGLAAVAWQDPLVNYVQVVSTYNANVWNFGSWGPHIPGWLSPQGATLAEPIMGFWSAYVFTAFLLLVATNRVMDRAKARWPEIGTAGMLGVAFAFNLVSGIGSEILAIRSGLYAFGGAIRGMSLFAGTRNQLPLYEAVCNAVLIGGFACLRWFRNERGETVAERGIERVRTGARGRTWVRGLALVGATNAIFFTYNVSWSWFTLDPDPWPQELIEAPYLLDGVCGPGTEYACPGPEVPIPKETSGHIDADGRYVPPDGG
jgi:hypothetical protein